MTEIELFEAAWTMEPEPLGPWRHAYKQDEWMAFAEAADEAASHDNGMTLLPLGRDVPARFREDLLIRFLGANTGPQGCCYYGFLFTVPGKLEVMAWIEDDSIRSRVRWRGDKASFERLALDLTLFGGDWLPDLPQAA